MSVLQLVRGLEALRTPRRGARVGAQKPPVPPKGRINAFGMFVPDVSPPTGAQAAAQAALFAAQTQLAQDQAVAQAASALVDTDAAAVQAAQSMVLSGVPGAQDTLNKAKQFLASAEDALGTANATVAADKAAVDKAQADLNAANAQPAPPGPGTPPAQPGAAPGLSMTAKIAIGVVLAGGIALAVTR
jgi:multidrug efflux pump subunit AcrA (membrane-fusion protein)